MCISFKKYKNLSVKREHWYRSIGSLRIMRSLTCGLMCFMRWGVMYFGSPSPLFWGILRHPVLSHRSIGVPSPEMSRCQNSLFISSAKPGGPRGRAVERCLLITRSSHRCVRCGFDPRIGHMWDKPNSACEFARFFCCCFSFQGFSRFRPTSSRYKPGCTVTEDG